MLLSSSYGVGVALFESCMQLEMIMGHGLVNKTDRTTDLCREAVREL